jgi:O-antigen biosynthesis protein
VQSRPNVRGKFLFVGDEKFYIKGVTYGPFRPTDDGSEYGTEESVRRDFSAMAGYGINTVRIYTVPPRWVLDIAYEYNLYVFIGIPWEQHIAFLNGRTVSANIKKNTRKSVRSVAGHPAIFGYSVGNEIPASIVRWHGRKNIERFIRDLYTIIKEEDPESLVTYINYPTTEYLQLPFVDFHCFNVYLETPEKLAAYFSRLHTIAGDKPLVLGELGLDSLRNGEDRQADVLSWQIETAFAEGSAGVFIFSWTDEWYRGGFDIEDWDFGLTRRDRTAKPALYSVVEKFSEVPFKKLRNYPFVSVVVCTYNGSATLYECCEGLRNLNYPNYEVIVVNDGSTDGSGAIAEEFGFKVITIENGGLSNARNVGWKAAAGEIVAYIDDDAFPDPDWLDYLVHTYRTSDVAAVGGTNIAPHGRGMIAEVVDNSPGGPTHVLINDRIAEHIPGCNMSIRRECLEAIGGFDTQFRIAGDDVDMCWRIQEHGWKIGFNSAAMVWHHRRNSIRRYLKQQYNYGKAEAMLEEKWPEKYNTIGHQTWKGRIYGKGLTPLIIHRGSLIYQGMWGTAPFQRLYEPALGRLTSLPLMPEGFVFIAFFFVLSLLGLISEPLLLAVPFFLLGVGISLSQATLAARRATFWSQVDDNNLLFKKRFLTGTMHLLQPMVRLLGRVSLGLTPLRFRGKSGWLIPKRKEISVWSMHWRSPDDWLRSLELKLKQSKVVSYRGGNYSSWDIAIAGGMFGVARLILGVEEHGGGKQNLRWRILPLFSLRTMLAVGLLGVVTLISVIDKAWIATGLFGAMTLIPLLRWVFESGQATADFESAIKSIGNSLEEEIEVSSEDNIVHKANGNGNGLIREDELI